MNFFKAVWNEFTGFWGFGNLINILHSGHYSDLLTWKGATAMLGPIIPVLLLLEIIRAVFYKRFNVIEYKI